ncbi:MAG: hypothetical protein QM703_19265 [Gemmatales bacterium]
MAWFHKHFTLDEQQFLLGIYGERVLRFAAEEGIDVSDLSAYLDGTLDLNDDVFEILGHLDDFLGKKPDTQICHALQGLLANGVLISTCVRAASRSNAIHYFDFNDVARRAYEEFWGLWKLVMSLPEIKEWQHLESWKQVVATVSLLNQTIETIYNWPDVWLRLQRVFKDVEEPNIESLRAGIKNNLLRLQDGLRPEMGPMQIARVVESTHDSVTASSASSVGQGATAEQNLSDVELTRVPDIVVSATHVRIEGKMVKISARRALVQLTFMRLVLKYETVGFTQLRNEIKTWADRYETDDEMSQAVSSACFQLNRKLRAAGVSRKLSVERQMVYFQV